MPDSKPTPPAETPAEFSLFASAGPDRSIAPADIVAAVVSLAWLALVGGFFLFAGSGADSAFGSIMVLVAIFLPVLLIWVAAITLRGTRAMRAETERLQATIDAMRHAYLGQIQAGTARLATDGPTAGAAEATGRPAVLGRLPRAEPAAARATFSTRREPLPEAARDKAALGAPKSAPDEQPALALGTPAEDLVLPVSVADFIRALNFPDTPTDKEGFRALRHALDDRAMAKLIRAAQDMLTLLSQDGIYMDDLAPDRARPEVWRRFAQGERGRAIAALGGVRDRSSLALSAARMRQDTIFRDAAHHFLRQFDRTFTAFEKNASDVEIADLAETRTARAFMLLGRVTGIFD